MLNIAWYGLNFRPSTTTIESKRRPVFRKQTKKDVRKAEPKCVRGVTIRPSSR